MGEMMTHTLRAVLLLGLMASPLAAQDPASVRKLLESGNYQEVVQHGESPAAPPDVVYAAAQAQQKLGNDEAAAGTYRRLADSAPGSPWHFIGVSGEHLVRNQNAEAVGAAQQAVSMADGLADAHFQLGLAKAKLQDWAGAAEAFDRAAQLNPSLAYAYYYGGLMHYRANRPDRMANQFDRFLKLAPTAPERPEVMQIMKTVRGR